MQLFYELVMFIGINIVVSILILFIMCNFYGYLLIVFVFLIGFILDGVDVVVQVEDMEVVEDGVFNDVKKIWILKIVIKGYDIWLVVIFFIDD